MLKFLGKMTDFTTIDVAKLFQGIVQQVFVILKTILNTERFVKAKLLFF